MSVIGKVSAVFTANSSGLVTGVNQAARSMRALEGNVSSLAGGMRTLVAIQGAQLFGSMATAAGGYIRSLVAMGSAQAEVIDGQSKLAARLGMTLGDFQNLATAADLAGVGSDALAAAATKADVAFVKASKGSATARAAFDAIGLSVDELGRMSPAERFEAIGAAIAALPTEAQRSAAAVQLFGRAGAQLLPLFGNATNVIGDAVDEAARLGPVLSSAQGRDVEAMNDSFTKVSESVNRVVRQVVAYLSPAITAAADGFRQLIVPENGANIGQQIAGAIMQGARFLAGIGDYVIQNFSSVFTYLSEVGQQWGNVWQFVGRVGSLLAGVADSMQVAFGLVIQGITGPVQALMEAAQFIGRRLGFDTAGLDAAVAQMDAFNDAISDGITENINSAASNFQAAFADEAAGLGQAVTGPLTTALDQAYAQAQASANQIEESGRGAAAEMAASVAAAVEPQAIRGVDSRSQEGVAEMFRLMRGGDSVQEQQLSVLEQIAANTAGGDEDDFAVEF
jgi:hypothetical protein